MNKTIFKKQSIKMKKFFITLSILILTGMFVNLLIARDNKNEKKVTISYQWTRINTHGSNQIAIWIEDTKGKLICTLFATHFTATGGYQKRPVSLSEWTSKCDLKNATKQEVDAVTGATPSSGKQTLTWNCKDNTGKEVPAGTYVVRMEANILDTDKMFFTGKIQTGGNNVQTTGEITFSKSELANGNVLFKDVVVEYN
jgi:hypothetical protein